MDGLWRSDGEDDEEGTSALGFVLVMSRTVRATMSTGSHEGVWDNLSQRLGEKGEGVLLS